jgi:hypothetical protein
VQLTIDFITIDIAAAGILASPKVSMPINNFLPMVLYDPIL